jgi:hypothetical protein
MVHHSITRYRYTIRTYIESPISLVVLCLLLFLCVFHIIVSYRNGAGMSHMSAFLRKRVFIIYGILLLHVLQTIQTSSACFDSYRYRFKVKVHLAHHQPSLGLLRYKL